MPFLAFLSVYAKLSFLSRKFSLSVIYLPIMCLWCSKTPPFAFAWRKGNVATRPTGVATRRFAHFLTSPERSVSRVQRHSTAKKNSRPTRHLLFIPRRKSKSISTGLRHKPQMPRFPSWVFLFAVLFEEHATDTDRLRKRVKWREKHCFIMNIYAPSPSLTKRV